MRIEDRVIRDLRYGRGEHPRRDTEFPASRADGRAPRRADPPPDAPNGPLRDSVAKPDASQMRTINATRPHAALPLGARTVRSREAIRIAAEAGGDARRAAQLRLACGAKPRSDRERFAVRDLLGGRLVIGPRAPNDLRSQMLIAQRFWYGRALWLRRRPARPGVRKIGTVVSRSPAPRFGVGQGKISTWSIGRRRRLTGIGATTVVGVARCRVRRAVQHRWNEQQRRGAEDHEHERNDACLLRKNVKCGAPDEDQQNSGGTEDRERNAKAETRSPLLTADLSSDIHRSDQHYRERECPGNHVHDSRTLAPTPGELLKTSRSSGGPRLSRLDPASARVSRPEGLALAAPL